MVSIVQTLVRIVQTPEQSQQIWNCTFLVRAFHNAARDTVQSIEVVQVRQLHCVVQRCGTIAILESTISIIVQQDAHNARVLLLGSQVEGCPFLIRACIHLCSCLQCIRQQVLSYFMIKIKRQSTASDNRRSVVS